MGLADGDDDSSLQDLWQAAQVRFLKATRRKAIVAISLEEALSDLEKRSTKPPKGSDDDDNRIDLKAVASNVIHFIQLLGGLAAQGASMVFAPASMCFNALQILLDIPATIGKLYGAVAALLEQIQNFMQQFQIYRSIEAITTLDREFRYSVHRMMLAFVDICIICLDFSRGGHWGSTKKITKYILLGDDSGVGSALSQFEKLAKQHSAISDAVTLKRVVQAQNEANSNAHQIWERLNESAEESRRQFQPVREGVELLVRDSDERRQKEARLETIQKLNLRLEGSGWSEDKESLAMQVRRQAVAGTGMWLWDLPEYQRWADVSCIQDRIMLLSGETGTGKTCLFANIVDRFASQYARSENEQKQVSLTYYAFEASNGLFDSAEDTSSFHFHKSAHALKLAAMEFAREDYVYARFLSSTLDEKENIIRKNADLSSICAKVFSHTTMPDSANRHYILLLDGLDQLPKSEAKSLFQALVDTKAPHLKIAISGTSEALQACRDASYPKPLQQPPLISLESNNVADVKQYTKSKLRTLKTTYSSNMGAIRKVVAELRREIPRLAESNYRTIDTICAAVENAVRSEKSTEEIVQLIRGDALRNTDLPFDQAVKELKASLSAEEVQQLNELLIWTLYGPWYVDIPRMKAALFLLLNRNIYQDLKEKVNQRFSKLLMINERGRFDLSNPDLSDYFRKLPRLKQDNHGEDSSDEPRISMQITITNAKVSHVQRFFWDLSEKVVLEKMNSFSFANPVTSVQAEVQIGVGRLDGELHILRRYFELLLDEAKAETKALASSATNEVLDNLPRGQDKQSLSDSEKQFITQRLVTLLRNPDLLEPHLCAYFFRFNYMLGPHGVSGAIEYLKDDAATRTLQALERSWIRSVLRHKYSAYILSDIAKMVAQHWLCKTKYSAHQPFNWLLRYLNEIHYRVPVEKDDDESGASEGKGSQHSEDGATLTGESDSDTSTSTLSSSRRTGSSRPGRERYRHRTNSDYVRRRSSSSASSRISAFGRPMLVRYRSPGSGGSSPVRRRGSSSASSSVSSIQANVVELAQAWCEREAGIVGKNTLWYERAALTHLWRAGFGSDLGISDSGDSDGEEDDIRFSDRPYTSPQMVEAAKQPLLDAKTNGAQSWRICAGLAYVHGEQKDYVAAIGQMEVALRELRGISCRDEAQQNGFVRGLKSLAEWQARLENYEEAETLLRDLDANTPESPEGQFDLLKLYSDTRQWGKARELLESLTVTRAEREGPGKLVSLLIMLCTGNAYDWPRDSLTLLTSLGRQTNRTELIFEAYEAAKRSVLDFSGEPDLKEIKDDNTKDTLIKLNLCHGEALAHHDNSDGEKNAAVQCFLECIRICAKRTPVPFEMEDALESLINHVITLIRRGEGAGIDVQKEVSRIQSSVEEANRDVHRLGRRRGADDGSRLMLASLYRLSGRVGEAKQVLFTDMQDAFDLLSDENTRNDDVGYIQMSNIFSHVGDDLNAISAWSLIGPRERLEGVPMQLEEPFPPTESANGPDHNDDKIVNGASAADPDQAVDEGSETADQKSQTSSVSSYDWSRRRLDSPRQIWCRGSCSNSQFKWTSRVWCCKICEERHFCDACFEKLKSGSLSDAHCKDYHEWLQLPSWTSEYLVTGPHKVRVGGTLPPADGLSQDGTREGGDVMPVTEWLDAVRAQWGIEKKAAYDSTLSIV